MLDRGNLERRTARGGRDRGSTEHLQGDFLPVISTQWDPRKVRVGMRCIYRITDALGVRFSLHLFRAGRCCSVAARGLLLANFSGAWVYINHC